MFVSVTDIFILNCLSWLWPIEKYFCRSSPDFSMIVWLAAKHLKHTFSANWLFAVNFRSIESWSESANCFLLYYTYVLSSWLVRQNIMVHQTMCAILKLISYVLTDRGVKWLKYTREIEEVYDSLCHRCLLQDYLIYAEFNVCLVNSSHLARVEIFWMWRISQWFTVHIKL